MSTGVDELQTNGSLRVEAIIELSTQTDAVPGDVKKAVKSVNKMSTGVDTKVAGVSKELRL